VVGAYLSNTSAKVESHGAVSGAEIGEDILDIASLR
jgi:hypothetical protein